MDNVGRKILDFYCNGFAGRRYDLSGAVIEHEANDYIIIRTEKGEAIMIDFYIWESGEVQGIRIDKQKLIDEWCHESRDC